MSNLWERNWWNSIWWPIKSKPRISSQHKIEGKISTSMFYFHTLHFQMQAQFIRLPETWDAPISLMQISVYSMITCMIYAINVSNRRALFACLRAVYIYWYSYMCYVKQRTEQRNKTIIHPVKMDTTLACLVWLQLWRLSYCIARNLFGNTHAKGKSP